MMGKIKQEPPPKIQPPAHGKYSKPDLSNGPEGNRILRSGRRPKLYPK